MIDRKAFFDSARKSPFEGSLAQGQVDGMNAILDGWERRQSKDLPSDDIRWLAYMLATVLHETARTMQPIREFGQGKGKAYGTTYYGRGFVQLTWETNYRKMSPIVGVDLVAHPDKALELPIAARIMFEGMIRGSFTGHRLADHIAGAMTDYVGARRIINGSDRAVTIAGYAVQFERALKAAPILVSTVDDEADPITEPEPSPRQPDDPGPIPEPAGFWRNLFAAILAAMKGD